MCKHAMDQLFDECWFSACCLAKMTLNFWSCVSISWAGFIGLPWFIWCCRLIWGLHACQMSTKWILVWSEDFFQPLFLILAIRFFSFSHLIWCRGPLGPFRNCHQFLCFSMRGSKYRKAGTNVPTSLWENAWKACLLFCCCLSWAAMFCI